MPRSSPELSYGRLARLRNWDGGGVSAIAKLTKLSRTTIYAGLAELERDPADSCTSIRRPGGGRRRLTVTDPKLLTALELLLEPTTRKSSKPLLRWTCKNTQQLAKDLQTRRHEACPKSIGKLLRGLGYRLYRGQPHPDRDKQFDYLNQQLRRFQRQGLPEVVVETDLRINQEAAQFVADSILRWWQDIGRRRFRRVRELLITADFDSQRAGAWKLALQRLADDTGLQLTVVKAPLGTSRWTMVEKQLICTWASKDRGRSGEKHSAEVSLVGIESRNEGRPAEEILDSVRHCDCKVSRAAVACVNQTCHKFKGHWNFTISPRHPAKKLLAADQGP